MENIDLREQQQLLERAEELQAQFWEALQALEAALGFDVDGTRDLSEVSAADLIAEQQQEQGEED